LFEIVVGVKVDDVSELVREKRDQELKLRAKAGTHDLS